MRACADAHEFPPYLQFERRAGRPTGRVYGQGVELALAAVAPRRLDITPLPWARCLVEAAAGRFDLVMDAARTPEREAHFLFPRPLYSITQVLARRREPNNRPIERIQDLHGLRQCRVIGWANTADTVIPPAPPGSSNTVSLEAALTMLRSQRCDLVALNLEYVEAARQHQRDWPRQAAGLEFVPIPWNPRMLMHLMVSRAQPYASTVLERLDRRIEQLQTSGEAARILGRAPQPTTGGSQ